MSYPYSLVILCPAEHRDAVEAAGVQLGHSGNEYTVPVSPTGEEPATHYGLRAAATAETVHLWTEAEDVPGLDAGQVEWLRETLIIDASLKMSNAEHFDTVCAENGLKRVVMPVETEKGS